MKIKVKICGIKTYGEAQAAFKAGADFLGFNFVPTSKRYINQFKAKAIIDKLCRSAKIVGVFQNERIGRVRELINLLQLDFVQLHGDESPEYISSIRGAGVIKTISLPADFDVEETIERMRKYKAHYFLLDRKRQGRGELLNPAKVRELTSVFPVILGGGLTAENVVGIIQIANPHAVDVAGGVETAGVKDKEKIIQFIKIVRNKVQLERGYFGKFGGQFVSELLYPALKELDEAFNEVKKDNNFQKEYRRLLADFAGRPTPLYFAQNTSGYLGFKVYFKREDLLNGGSHKLNNALGQALLAKYMGKRRIVTETAAGMHGVAATMASNVVGLECQVFMGVKDIERQKLNAEKIKLLGGKVIPVTRGHGVLKDAVSEAIVSWIRDLPNTHYLIGSTVGPHPFPSIVAYFQKIIGEETRGQILEKEGRPPKAIIACGSGGSNALGVFQGFLSDEEVELVFVEGEESAAFKYGSIGIFQGTKTYVLQDEFGMDRKTTSRAAGLNYPARGPQLAYLVDSGRIKVSTADDHEVLAAFKLMGRLEGLLPALETSHALVELFKRKGKYKKDDCVILNFSGRGDKDMETVMKISNS